MQSQSTNIPCICLHCGISFDVPPKGWNRGRGKYCSLACNGARSRIPVADRLRARGERKENGCLMWTGYTHVKTGYGQIAIGRQTLGVHAVAYREWIGPIPAGHSVQHTCDVQYAPGDRTYRRCFEPSHLTTGTPLQNQQHMAAVGRAATGARNAASK